MKIIKIETNIKRKLFLHQTENISLYPTPNNLENSIIKIFPEYNFQNILGFGGAITESTAYILNNINSDICNKILDEYFLKDGLNYNICRLPIGSCDFSTNSYSYSYKEDLSDFNVNKDNTIISTVKSAQKRNNNLLFLSSTWSPPAFMKDNKKLSNGGKLLQEYYQLFANYLAKYVLEYKKQNIPIDFMTIQNEPDATQIWESCKYSPKEEATLLKNYLYPTFNKYGLNTKFLIWDHNKDKLLERAIEVFIENNCLDYSVGIAFHWYTGNHFENISLLNNLFPDKLLLHTEGCTGYSNFKPQDELFNAEMYASEIIGDLNNGCNGFIDWNIVLDYNRRSKSCKKLL